MEAIKPSSPGKEKKPSYVWVLTNNRCPHCREGKLFMKDNAYDLKSITKMYKNCPVCGQPTEIEVGFYYGTSYVSYVIAVLVSALTFIVWWLIIGFSLDDNRIFYWLCFNAIFIVAMQPLLMRFSRTFWLSCFVSYDPAWKEKEANKYERVVEEEMNNW